MKYTTTQIVLHWLTVLLIVAMVATGLAYRFDLADKLAITAHQVIGQGLIVVLLLRLELRLTKKQGPDRNSHALWERALAASVHWGLYLTMTLFVVTGYVSASALGENALMFPVDLVFARSDFGEQLLEMHYMLKWVLLALFSLHLAAVVKHMIWDRDATLHHMSLPQSQENTNA